MDKILGKGMCCKELKTNPVNPKIPYNRVQTISTNSIAIHRRTQANNEGVSNTKMSSFLLQKLDI